MKQPFSSVLAQSGVNWRQVGMSSAVHLVGVLAAALFSVLAIHELPMPEQSIEISFIPEPEIDEPIPVVPKPIPKVPKPVVRPKPIERPAPVIPPPIAEVRPPEPIEPPKPEPKKIPAPVQPPKPKPKVEIAGFDVPKPADAPATKRDVRTDLFSEGSSAEPTLDAPAKKVQTGGFGDPEGVASAQITRKAGARPQLGSFDLPQGPGHGNGSGGASGQRGTVASAGFGNGIATAIPETPPKGSVRQAGFGEATAPAEAPKPRQRVVESATLPVEIVSKPKPVYTNEARDKHLEGEVVLEVLFSSSGRTQVLRVVKGLGFGLDESAVRAAERILFKPARRDGQPVDYTAVVRMVFQLT